MGKGKIQGKIKKQGMYIFLWGLGKKSSSGIRTIKLKIEYRERREVKLTSLSLVGGEQIIIIQGWRGTEKS